MWRDLQVSATWGDDLLEAARRARYETNNSKPTKKNRYFPTHETHRETKRVTMLRIRLRVREGLVVVTVTVVLVVVVCRKTQLNVCFFCSFRGLFCKFSFLVFLFQSCSRDETNTLNKSSSEFQIRLKPISQSTVAATRAAASASAVAARRAHSFVFSSFGSF